MVVVTHDPDEVLECVCTDPPLSAAERLEIAERRLGVELLPWQRAWALRALDGEHQVILRGRRAGWKTLLRVVEGARSV